MLDGNLDKLAEALAKAQGEIKPPVQNCKVDFTDKNGRRIKYSYADLAAVIDSVRVPLSKHGLALVHQTINNASEFGMLTVLMHSSGQQISTWYPLPHPSSLKPQEFGSAISYGRRYSLSSLIGIASEADDDGAQAEAPSPRPRPNVTPKVSADAEPAEFKQAREQREKAQAEAERLLTNNHTKPMLSVEEKLACKGEGRSGNMTFSKVAAAIQAKVDAKASELDPGEYVIKTGGNWGLLNKRVMDVNEQVLRKALNQAIELKKKGHNDLNVDEFVKHTVAFLKQFDDTEQPDHVPMRGPDAHPGGPDPRPRYAPGSGH